MAFDYINEAFKRLDLLEEQMFHASADGISSLNSFLTDSDEDVVKVIDPEATSEDEIQDSYVGKVIINCNVCHSHVFNNKEDITLSEEGVVNADVACPYCGETEGFTIVGEIAPYNAEPEVVEDEVEVVAEPAPEESTENSDVIGESIDTPDVNHKISRATRRLTQLEEDFKEVSITTDDQHLEMTSDENGKVTVTTEPVENMQDVAEDVISPVSDETAEVIMTNNDLDDITANDSTEEDIAVEAEEDVDAEVVEPEQEEIEIDEVDEASFDELGESYLRKVYENVESFKTTNVSSTPTQLIVEGLIKFNSGATKRTGFMFEAKDSNANGRVRFSGRNNQLCEGIDAFTLVGSVDNKKLFVESLKYNYTVNNNTVRGVVRRK